jgi:hypothetical protein
MLYIITRFYGLFITFDFTLVFTVLLHFQRWNLSHYINYESIHTEEL